MKKFIKKSLPYLFLVSLLFSAHTTFAANLSVSPVSATYQVGDKIILKVMVSSRVPINAVSGVLNIPTSLFTIESISKSGSVLNFWVTEPNFSKGAGLLSFEGVNLEGFPGGTKTVVTATLRAVSVGTGTLSFKSGQILANDGAGTDITDLLTGATFSVKEAIPKDTTPKVEPIPTLEPEMPQPSPTLKAPEIMLGTIYGAEAILGTSDYGKVQVLITFITEDGTKVFILGVADIDGSFNVLVPHSLKRGSYTVSSVIIKEDKTNSDISNVIILKIGNIVSDITWEIWVIILLLIISVLYLLLRIYFHFGKNRNSREFVNKHKLYETQEFINKSFNFLRDDVIDRTRGIVSSVERTNIEELKKDIDSTEKVITKEIKDIESV